MRHRILHVIPSLDRAGAEKQLLLLARGLPREEFDVHVCALTRGGPLEEDFEAAGIPVTVIGKRWSVDPHAYWQLRNHIRSLRPDLVQTWLFAANSYGRAAALQTGVKHVVASERCVDLWKTWQHAIVDRYLAKKTGAIVVNSTGVREFYVARGLPAEKFELIPNGVLPAAPSEVTREQLLAELGLPAGVHLIGAIGRLWPQKRIKDLIWATDLIKVIRGDVHLLIVGDGPERATLERYRDLCHIPEHVHFLGHRNDAADLLPHCDLLWLASGYEGLPNAIMEAMAAGVPVVASDILGNRDLVVPGETGYLVPVGDRGALARWAHTIIDDAEMRNRLGEAGRRRVLEHFSARAMVGRYADLYRRLLSSSG